jgi:hypothetical protein
MGEEREREVPEEGAGASERARRLAAAMRANLRKRKEQQRARQASEPEDRGGG